MHMVRFAGAMVALELVVAACSGSNGQFVGSGATPTTAPITAPTQPPAPAPSPTSAPTGSPVTTTGFSGDAKQAQVNGQTILVDAASGLALYFFNGDTTDHSNCTGTCLTIWPSHAATASEKADGNFSIFTRSDGNGMQWAYKGRPLYTFISDTTAHNATGNGVQNFSLATP